MQIESRFINRLDVEKVSEDPERWKVLVPFSYQSKIYGGIITVPAGFLSDFASVPRLPLAYWLTGGCADESALIHDFLYQTHKTSFMEANRIFYEAMTVQHVALWRRSLMFQAVCIAGWPSYKSGPSRYTRLLS